MNKVRVAIVGCGAISQLGAPGYLRDERCEVAALCDPVQGRAELRARQWGIRPRIYERYEDVLADPGVDAVELLTPTYLHPQQAIAALEAGKHVSVQKPISNTVAEADAVIAAADHAKATARVIENFLFYPPLVKAKELLDSGAIGEPTMVRIRTLVGKLGGEERLPLMPETMTWRNDPKLNPGGRVFDSAWHNFATAMWWIGDVEKVTAVVSKTEGFYMEAPSAITWKFQDRDCLAVFELSHAPEMYVRGKYYTADDFFEIQGSRGLIWVTRCSGEMLDMPPVVLYTGTETTSYQVPTDWIEGFNGSARNFVDSIISDTQPLIDVRFARKVLQAVMAAYRSSETEAAVEPATMA